jgi:protease I
MSPTDLTGTTVAILAAEGVEQVELVGPWEALEAAGATVHLVSTDEVLHAFEHLDRADDYDVDRQIADVNPDTYDALVLPGGVANPDHLRTDEQAVAFVGSFLTSGKPVAAICHAAWTLIEADGVRDRQVTSWPSLRTDLTNAGASWVDEEVAIDRSGPGPLITSRNPDDVPAFSQAIVDELGATG